MTLRFVQSRACPAILAVFCEDVGVKLTMSGRPPWGAVPESEPGTTFNANDQCWQDVDPARVPEAEAALAALYA